jgi:hypothetical protein
MYEFFFRAKKKKRRNFINWNKTLDYGNEAEEGETILLQMQELPKNQL